jgi:hypothetical protein
LSLLGSKPDFTRLGRTLRADGLVLMQTIYSSAGTNLAMRLVAVNSGAVLDGALFRLPLPDAVEWQKLATNRLLPLLPKLTVPGERAVPISLLNLRSAVGTPASLLTEKSVSALLFHRLMVEQDFFVLERRQMGKLVWEKDLPGPDAQPFWNGSFLLEGVLDRDGVDPDVLTIHARLSPPGQSSPIELQASGPRTKPDQAVEQLVSRILSALHRQSTVATWSPDNEAKRYEEEAAWALRWKVWPEAYVAADSAYALGLRTESVVSIKMRALMEQAHTPNTFVYEPRWRSWVTDESAARWVFDPVRNCGWNEQPPLPQVAPNALEALELFRLHCLSTDANSWRTNAAWLQLGAEALETAAGVLRHHYFFGWRQNRFDDTLPDLRAAARDVFTLLSTSQNKPSAAEGEVGQTASWVFLAGMLGPLWQESPQATIDFYRNLMATGDYARIRVAFLTGSYNGPAPPYGEPPRRSWKDPLWVGWTPRDRELGQALWNSFVVELLNSTNRTLRADGALLKLRDSIFDPDIAMATEQFYDAAMDEHRLSFRTDIDGSFNDAFDALLGQKTLRQQRLFSAWKEHSFARLKHYLQTARVQDYHRCDAQIIRKEFTSSEAVELIPIFQDYAKRFPGGLWLDSVDKHLRECAAKTVTNPIATQNSVPAQSPASNSQPRLPALFVSRYWKAVSHDAVSPGLVDSSFESLLERDGRIFAVVPERDHPGYQGSGSFIEIDPLTGARKELASGIFHGRTWRLSFEVLDDHIYWIDDANSIGQARCSTGVVRYFKLDLPLARAELFTSAGRLFIASPEAIAEFFPRDGSFKLLASSRRRPPANKLDAWNWPTIPALDICSDGSILAFFSQTYMRSDGPRQVWAGNPANSEWKQLPTLGAQSQSSCHLAPGRFLFYHTGTSDCLDWVSSPDGAVETLLSHNPSLLPRWSMPLDYPISPGLGFYRPGSHFFDGTNLWMLLPPSKTVITTTRNGPVFTVSCNSRPLNDRQATLLWFAPEWEMPRVIPLRLETNLQSSLLADCASLHAEALFTKHGLLLPANTPMLRGSAGFWFLPWTELRSWVAQHCPDSRNLPRREPGIRQQFDTNKNGILDADELEAMRSNTAWLKANAEFNSRRLLLTFDANGDDKLDLAEITNLVLFSNLGVPPADSRPQLSPLDRYRADPATLLREFDRDHNGTLEPGEVASLYAALSLSP